MADIDAADYVWHRLPRWLRRLAGRQAVERVTEQALDAPFEGDCSDVTATVLERCGRDQALGGILLAALLPILVEYVVRLVAEWLKERNASA